MIDTVILGPSLGGGRNFLITVVVFSTRESTMGLTGWSLSYGTSEFPDCGNLVGADRMRNLRWANTEPSMHYRKTNMDPSVHLRQANTDPSVHFRKANTEFFLPVLLPTSKLIQVLFPT